MITAAPTGPTPSTRAQPRPAPLAVRPRRGADLAAGALGTTAMAAATCWLLGLPTSHAVEAVALYAVLATLVLRGLPRAHSGPGIGLANRVTLLRATLVLPLVALALHPRPLGGLGYGWIVAIATVAMMLDGVDGIVARRTRSASAFGARFDMELDAALLMALSVLLWEGDKLGSWVLLIGGLRYLFVVAGLLWTPLQGALPPSFRRKTVCVWQGVSLLLALSPVTAPALAALIAGTSLIVLIWSFAIDVRWLALNEARP